MSQPPPLPQNTDPILQYANLSNYKPPSEVVRQDNWVIVPRDGPWPARCVKCNQPASPRYTWKKTLYWHPPGLYFLILFPGLLIYAIVALIVRKGSKVDVGLCELHGKKRGNRIMLGWLIALAGLASLIGAFFFGVDPDFKRPALGATLGIAGLVLLLGSLIWAIVGVRVIWPKKIDGMLAWFGGASPEFLNSIPDASQNEVTVYPNALLR